MNMTAKEKGFVVRKVMRNFLRASRELSETKGRLDVTGMFEETVAQLDAAVADLDGSVEELETVLQRISAEVAREEI